jgi:hypothetical protein
MPPQPPASPASPAAPVTARTIPLKAWILTSPILLLALVPFFANLRSAPRSGQTFTRDWAVDLLNSVEPYGILITNGDNDTFPLWYAQEVEGVRKDVIVAVTSLLGTDWYVRGILLRPIYPYDAAKGPAIYRDKTWTKPAGPPLQMTMQEADAIPEYVQLQSARQFRKDSIVATLRAGIVTRDQLIVLRFIKDSFPERPLYFSSPFYPENMGLGGHIVTQGLAQKLVMNPVHPDGRDTVRTPYGVFDMPRTRALWASVYMAPAALLRQGNWVDTSSVGIPLQYVLNAYAVGSVLDQQGDHASSTKFLQLAFTLAHAAHLDALFRRS